MSNLSSALQELLNFLEKRDLVPPMRNMFVIEVQADTPRDERGRLLIGRRTLRDPHEFEARFESLMSAGFPWLNLSCIGMAEGRLIVTVETPRSSSGLSARTSVNYSGPSRAVLEQGWDASRVLTVR